MRLLLPVLLAAGCGHRYQVNEVAEHIPNVFLHEVRVKGGSTRLTLRLEADEACQIGVSPPGDPAAFRLRSGERTFALTDVSGVEELPGRTSVGARRSRKFALTFEPLPQDVAEFRVAGDLAGAGHVAFDVRLREANVRRCW
jgi:hypothetical protein